nr:zinc finger B-box domain-containing protein 1 isoform X1 [Pogona vitticeps]XP_020661421.1 zinc finger B-box domain-containing protein 1 isoform X1 [Pogona vitticeps]XP_020661422.1 zinc finger B-box domain-containing protein 1 isoform X1 [Pogona vitticeps]
MNVNDFVILPGSKTGLSVKLKAKSIRELQLEKTHLELENKEMEKKLQQLQENMSREKQEREQANGYHWKSGQAGLGLQPQLLSQNKENIGKVSSGKVRLRVLKEQDQVSEAAKQATAHKIVTDVSAEKPKVKGRACGQCEIKSALLMCLECGEDYCPGCFARMHQKGALKLHRTTSLPVKSRVPVGKLEAAQQFLKEASTAPSSEVRLESQNGGSLLQGTFDEEVSAKSFQQVLNQWRSGNCSQKYKEERSCQVESENSGTCQVQTSPPVLKKPTEIEFKEDSLTYMEKLLIKKHRRTPVDKLPYSIIEDELKLETSLINETQNTCFEKEEEEEEEEEEDIAVARIEAEEMKKYWTDVFKKEPEVVMINSEPSLKIKILEDTFKEESEETATFVLMEAGSDEFDYSGTMSKNEKTEPDVFLAQAGNITTRSPLSPTVGSEKCLTFLHNDLEETPRVRAPFSQSERADAACGCSGVEEIVPTIPNKRAITKEKWPETKKSSSHMSFEQTFSPPKLVPGKPFPVMELPKDCKLSLELNEASPLTTKASLVALREKPVCNAYRGLERFFTMDTNCQQVTVDSFPSPSTARHSPSSTISFSGRPELWVKQLSLSECADDCVVQEVFKKELSRPSSRLGRKSPSHGALPSVLPGALDAGPTNPAAWPLSRAASEISEIESIDVTEHDDPFWEYSTDQQALADLVDELQSNSDPCENFSGLTSGDFSRHSKGPWQNLSDFHNSNEIGDYSKGDTIRVYDESYTDDEEDQRDRQQVIELH